MDPQKTKVPSPNSLPAVKPLATLHDDRQVFEVKPGRRIVLSPRRQAKKIIMRSEGLTSRQYRKLRKRLKREMAHA